MKTAVVRTASAPSFRSFLQAELARRCTANPRYSLRAFARRLEIHHSTLSQILRGRRALTARSIRRIGERLGLDAAALAAYSVVEPATHGGDEVVRLARDTASVIADWKHFAILELTRLDSFRPDVRWIAQVLGVTSDDVNEALTRLVRLRLLEMRAGGWADLSGNTVATFDDFSRAAVQQLSGWLASRLGSAPGEDRFHAVTTLAVNSARLPEAIAEIERFRTDLLARLQSDSARDSVVQLEIHLHPVTSTSPSTEGASHADADRPVPDHRQKP